MKPLLSSDIETYAEAHSWPESPVCRALREETQRSMEAPQMMVGPLAGAFLKMVTQLVGARRVLEIGMFTGYSALCFAEAMGEAGRVTTCEIDPQSAEIAKKYFSQSPVGRIIEIRMGPALETVKSLTGPFDLVFIDADKVNYRQYYEQALPLLAEDGVILIDNVLWSGSVLQSPAPDGSTEAIQDLNRAIANDSRVHATLVTVRDGMFMVRKAGRRSREVCVSRP